jgi:hypothetical protein
MSVNITVDKATGSNFQLVIPKIPSESTLDATDELILNIHGCPVPGITLGTEEFRWQAWTCKMAAPPIEFEPWSFTFTVDSEFRNWKVIYDWIMYINNNLDIAGKSNRPADSDTYTIDCTLKILNNFHQKVFNIQFKNAWPQNLGEVTMSQREGEVNLDATCTLMYDRYEVVN